MDVNDFLNTVGNVNSKYSLAAYTLAVVLSVINLAKGRREGAKTTSALWAGAIVSCVLGLAPTLATAYLNHLAAQASTVYRIRVQTVDPQHIPISGAVLRTTASNETTQTSQGTGLVAVYRSTMPSDGKVTIYADLDSAFLHGRSEIQLAADPNPSVTIELRSNATASITGLVEDSDGHAIQGATVTVLGGESIITSANGSFTAKANAAVDQQVRVHVEKKGYDSADQYQPAGREPVTIVLVKNKRRT